MPRLYPAVILIATVVLISCSDNGVSQHALLSTTTPLPAQVEATRIAPASPTLRPSSIPPTHAPPTETRMVVHQAQKPVHTHVISASISFLPNVEEGPTAVSFVDTRHGWLAFDTALLKTNDGGRSWQDVYDAPKTITSMSFISRQRGWIVVDERVYATRNGGITWSLLKTVARAGAIDFVDVRHGWFRLRQGEDSSLYRTTDGGVSWEQVVDPCVAKGYFPGRLNFASPQLGWSMCGGDGGAGMQDKELFRSNDGGVHWTSISRTDFDSPNSSVISVSGYLMAAFFLDTTHGWYSLRFGNTGGLEATDTAGQTWTRTGLGASDGRIPIWIRFITPAQGYVLIEDGGRTRALVATSDGGATWTQLYPSLTPTGQFHFFDQQHGIATGVPLDPGGVLSTSDAGRTWTQITAVKANYIDQMSFSDTQHGCIYAESFESANTQYLVYSTTDGGSSWNIRPNDDHCVSSAVLPSMRWQVLNDQLSSSNDGGATWTQYGLGRHFIPDIVSFVDANHAWFKDGSDHMYATTDGGLHWTQLN